VSAHDFLLHQAGANKRRSEQVLEGADQGGEVVQEEGGREGGDGAEAEVGGGSGHGVEYNGVMNEY
jgi:hypothetical protein